MAADSTIQPFYGELEWVLRYVGLPRSHESSRQTINCSTINCRARSTLRALVRMAVPPVLSSTCRACGHPGSGHPGTPSRPVVGPGLDRDPALALRLGLGQCDGHCVSARRAHWQGPGSPRSKLVASRPHRQSKQGGIHLNKSGSLRIHTRG
jgi:hypothetical protein